MKAPEFIWVTVSVMVLVGYTVFGAKTAENIISDRPESPTAVLAEAHFYETDGQAVIKTFTADYSEDLPDNLSLDNSDLKLSEGSDIIITAEKQPEKSDNELAVPLMESDFKAYMPYDSITDRTAPQWEYRNSAWTDINGLRRINDDYLVAMGTYYSESVGARFNITLDSGSTFTVTVGDIKDPAHTDTYNMYTPIRDGDGNFISANVIEFIVDTDKLDSLAAKLGTVSCIDGLEGNVVKIEEIE